MSQRRFAVVGGGIIGVAVARQLTLSFPGSPVTLLEKEPALGQHQSGHNSNVVHAGLYYAPESLKAKLCQRGRALLREFCQEHDLPYVQCGKVLVALDSADRARLHDIENRAIANGVKGVRLLDRDALREIEPEVTGIAGLHSPETAITDYSKVVEALAADARRRGAQFHTGCPVTGVRPGAGGVEVLAGGHTARYDQVVLCAGLQSDRVARLAGGARLPRIVPFRGEYYRLGGPARELVRGLVYPVPDPRYPFLGVHVTPRVDGEVMVGPNAVLALAREGYRWRDLSAPDLAETLLWGGFWRFAARHWRTGVREVNGSLRKKVFADQVRRYLPGVPDSALIRGASGVRAQAMDANGELVDDFRLVRDGQLLAVRNAPSPAATSSLAIAEHIVASLAA